MYKIFFFLLSTIIFNQTVSAQCTPDPSVTSSGFKVSDTCALKGQAFNSIITIYVPDTIEVSTVKIPIDSLVVKDIILGVGTGLVVTYMNGNKTIKAKVPYCANIGGPTVTGNVGTYSTKNTGNTKISFSADAYYNGSVTFQVTESLLEQAQLEIKFGLSKY